MRPFLFSDKGLLSKKHAAVWADVSQRTIDRWIQQGLPVYQASPQTKVLIRPADIELFLQRKQLPKADLIMKVEEVMAQLRRNPATSSRKRSDPKGCPESQAQQ